jgi:UBX domain-containing protein 1
MANVNSLSSLRKKEEADDKDNERYAGGVDNRGGGSGLSVQNPGDGRGDVFNRIMNKAQEGAQAGGPNSPSIDKVAHKITMYRNGFVVNDGPLRTPDDPANKTFLEQLAMGFVPQELQAPTDPNRIPGGLRVQPPAVDVSLDDRRDEDYVPPAYVAYSGEGVTLSSSSSSSEGTVVDPGTLGPAPTLDAAAPATTVQVKLLNGKKIRVKLNTANSVAQLCACIARDGGGADRYVLSSGFPPKDLVLASLDVSVGDAGLQGASITLKPA